MHDTYHCFLGDGFKCRELFSPCTSYDWWWILILPKSHIYCLYVKRVSRSVEHLRSHVEVEVTPAMSRYFSQRAIVSLHNSTFSKQRWHLKKKRWQIATFTYLVQPKCFCSVFAARLLPASRHTRCAPGRRLVQGLQRLARRRSLGGGGDWTADHMISEKNPLYHLSHSRHTCLLTTLRTGAISSPSIHTVAWRQSCLADDSVNSGQV